MFGADDDGDEDDDVELDVDKNDGGIGCQSSAALDTHQATV